VACLGIIDHAAVLRFFGADHHRTWDQRPVLGSVECIVRSVNRRDYVNGLAVAATVFFEFVSPRPSNAVLQSPLPSVRLDVDWPAPTVAIRSPWRPSANEHYLIRRRIHGGARNDLVSFATVDGASGVIEISRVAAAYLNAHARARARMPVSEPSPSWRVGVDPPFVVR